MSNPKAMALQIVRERLLRKYNGNPCFVRIPGEEWNKEKQRDSELCAKLGIDAVRINVEFVSPDGTASLESNKALTEN